MTGPSHMIEVKGANALHQMLLKVAVPVGLGLLIGCLSAIDPGFLPFPIPGDHLYDWVPTILVVALLGSMLAAFLLFTKLEWLFDRRARLAVIMVIVPAAFTGVNAGPLDMGDVAMVSVCCYWLITVFVEQQPIRTPLPILFVLGGLAFFMCASTINGQIASIRGLHTLITKLILLFLITNVIQTHSHHDLAIRCLIKVALFSAIAAVAFEVLYFATGIAITFDDLKEFQFKSTPLGRIVRATAFLPRAQALGHLLILGTALVLFVRMKLFWRLAALAVLGLGVACTFSAGAFLSLSVVFVVSVFLRRPRHSLHYLASFAGICVVAYLAGWLEWIYLKVLDPIGGAGLADRIEYNRVALDGIGRHPLLGGGVKNIFRILYTLVHNAYLQMTVDIGLIGGSLFLLMIVGLCVGAGLVVMRARSQETTNLLKGIFLGMIGVSVHFCTEPLYDNVGSWMYMGLVVATLMIYSNTNAHAEPKHAHASR